MRIAIYSRKSKFTGKGDSVENQIEMAREYIAKNMPGEHQITVFEDEGFSGRTTQRPQYQKMMARVSKREFDAVICYKFDRIGRDLADLFNMFKILERYNVDIISITENYDTTLPIGRLMRGLSSLFASFEVETTSARIKDNMTMLAKSGRWLGGSPPLGYRSERVTAIDASGKKRCQQKLAVEPTEIEFVRTLYRLFVAEGSLSKVEAYCARHGLCSPRSSTRRSKQPWIHIKSIKTILKNPVYCTADKAAYEFLVSQGYPVYSDPECFDSTHGLLAYGKTHKSDFSLVQNDISEWIVAVGLHEPAIDSSIWIAAQKIMLKNKDKSFRRPKSNDALLSGLLRCSKCGSYMRPKRSAVKDDGTIVFRYICELKEKTHCQNCSLPNAPAIVDKCVVKQIADFSQNSSTTKEILQRNRKSLSNHRNEAHDNLIRMEDECSKLDAEINALAESLTHITAPAAIERIASLIETKDAKLKQMRSVIQSAENEISAYDMRIGSLDLFCASMLKASYVLETATLPEKRGILNNLIHHIIWDGANLMIYFYYDGLADLKSSMVALPAATDNMQNSKP